MERLQLRLWPVVATGTGTGIARLIGLVVVLVVGLACKGRSTVTDTTADDAGPSEPLTIQPIEIHPLTMGVASPEAFNYPWGPGRKIYDEAAHAYRNKDWKAVALHAAATIAADPGHLDAHRILASALAQQGHHARAIEHLRIALAGDFVRWGGRVLGDPELEPLVQSPLGPRVQEMIDLHRREFTERARAGVAVVARRAPWKAPRLGKRRRVRMVNRAELFAFDRSTERYLRLSQTGFQVAGALPSPTGDRIAFVTIKTVATTDGRDQWMIGLGRVGQIVLDRPDDRPELSEFRNVERIAIQFRDGELIAEAADTSDQAGAADTSDQPADSRLLVGVDGATLIRPNDPPGIAADWDPQSLSAVEFVIDSSNQRIAVPSQRPAHGPSLAWSPDKRWLAFATAADPCHDQPDLRRATLYVAEAETGRTLTVTDAAVSPWPRFVGPTILAFDDPLGVGIYDAQLAREVSRLAIAGGVSLVGLGAQRADACAASEPELDHVVP